jgi:hypothetical protein
MSQLSYKNHHYTSTPRLLEMKQSLSVLSIVSLSRFEEGSGGQQISPQSFNKAFSTNPHNAYL